ATDRGLTATHDGKREHPNAVILAPVAAASPRRFPRIDDRRDRARPTTAYSAEVSHFDRIVRHDKSSDRIELRNIEYPRRMTSDAQANISDVKTRCLPSPFRCDLAAVIDRSSRAHEVEPRSGGTRSARGSRMAVHAGCQHHSRSVLSGHPGRSPETRNAGSRVLGGRHVARDRRADRQEVHGDASRSVPDLDRGRFQLESWNVSRGRVGRSLQRPRWNDRSLPPPLLNTRCVETPSGCTCALSFCPRTAIAQGELRPPAPSSLDLDPRLRRVARAACIGACSRRSRREIAREASISPPQVPSACERGGPMRLRNTTSAWSHEAANRQPSRGCRPSLERLPTFLV